TCSTTKTSPFPTSPSSNAPQQLDRSTASDVWLTATALAADLRCWFQLLALDGENAKATPKTLRYRILHVPARLTRGQRKRRLKLPDTWPWAKAITTAFQRILALPRPT
ncbi:transposase, partial [Streptomyces sp. NPDC051286]|uniref:transposase n=1 Tax=Streptomyces sp. NPDC051286 TaxID=3365647 RepID=UPI00378A53FC